MGISSQEGFDPGPVGELDGFQVRLVGGHAGDEGSGKWERKQRKERKWHLNEKRSEKQHFEEDQKGREGRKGGMDTSLLTKALTKHFKKLIEAFQAEHFSVSSLKGTAKLTDLGNTSNEAHSLL